MISSSETSESTGQQIPCLVKDGVVSSSPPGGGAKVVSRDGACCKGTATALKAQVPTHTLKFNLWCTGIKTQGLREVTGSTGLSIVNEVKALRKKASSSP